MNGCEAHRNNLRKWLKYWCGYIVKNKKVLSSVRFRLFLKKNDLLVMGYCSYLHAFSFDFYKNNMFIIITLNIIKLSRRT